MSDIYILLLDLYLYVDYIQLTSTLDPLSVHVLILILMRQYLMFVHCRVPLLESISLYLPNRCYLILLYLVQCNPDNRVYALHKPYFGCRGHTSRVLI